MKVKSPPQITRSLTFTKVSCSCDPKVLVKVSEIHHGALAPSTGITGKQPRVAQATTKPWLTTTTHEAHIFLFQKWVNVWFLMRGTIRNHLYSSANNWPRIVTCEGWGGALGCDWPRIVTREGRSSPRMHMSQMSQGIMLFKPCRGVASK